MPPQWGRSRNWWRQSPVPLIADVHFDHRLAVAALERGAAAVRINPGNIGGPERVREVVEAARERRAVIRIGVNSGSLQRDLRAMEEEDPAGALVESAVRYCTLFEEWGFARSQGLGQVVVTAGDHRGEPAAGRARALPVAPGRHRGGHSWAGSIRSAVALGALLAGGVGDTIRVSLTGDPVEEVRVAREILAGLGLARGGPRVISCPTCGRTRIDLEALAVEVERRLEALRPELDARELDLEVAVMGCIVNGPGEARKAAFGIAGGEGEGVIFVEGRPVKKVAQEHLVDELFVAIELAGTALGRRALARNGRVGEHGRPRAAGRPRGRSRPTRRDSMRASQLFMPTLKEDPSDAEAASHKLLVRGGFVRQFASGIYMFLPLGWRVMNRVNRIIREEMDAIGAPGALDADAASGRCLAADRTLLRHRFARCSA